MQNFPTHNRDIGATIIYVNSVNRFNTFFVFTLLILLSSWTAVSYASFKLESTTVILQESEARTSFTIDNISTNPILLVTKLTDLDGKSFSKQILISPVTRINAGQSQQVNFVLKKGTVLDNEVLLKASLKGLNRSPVMRPLCQFVRRSVF